MSLKSNFLKITLNTLIGLVLVIVWLQFVDINKIIDSLSTVSPMAVLLIMFFFFLSSVVRSLRLKLFLSPVKKIKFLDLLFLNNAATMLNYLIPVRGGDLMKGLYLSSNYNIEAGKAVVWVFLDRLLDFLGVIIFSALILIFVKVNLPEFFVYLIWLLGVALILVVYLMVYQVKIAKALVQLVSILLVFKRIKLFFVNLSEFFLDTFIILKRETSALFGLTVLTALAYLSDALIWYFALLYLGEKQDILRLYLGQLLSALTYLVPAAPGYVGSAEASGLLIFSAVLGLDPNLASAMTILYHLCITIFIIFFGIFSIYFLKIDLNTILKKIFKKD